MKISHTTDVSFLRGQAALADRLMLVSGGANFHSSRQTFKCIDRLESGPSKLDQVARE